MPELLVVALIYLFIWEVEQVQNGKSVERWREENSSKCYKVITGISWNKEFPKQWKTPTMKTNLNKY
jgi:hypothetical protein